MSTGAVKADAHHRPSQFAGRDADVGVDSAEHRVEHSRHPVHEVGLVTFRNGIDLAGAKDVHARKAGFETGDTSAWAPATR